MQRRVYVQRSLCEQVIAEEASIDQRVYRSMLTLRGHRDERTSGKALAALASLDITVHSWLTDAECAKDEAHSAWICGVNADIREKRATSSPASSIDRVVAKVRAELLLPLDGRHGVRVAEILIGRAADRRRHHGSRWVTTGTEAILGVTFECAKNVARVVYGASSAQAGVGVNGGVHIARKRVWLRTVGDSVEHLGASRPGG